MQHTSMSAPLSNNLLMRHEPFAGPVADPQVITILGDGLRRLFVIWNRGYKTICVLAVDQHEALHIAVECRHIKRAEQYRKFLDVTDRALAGEEIDAIGVIDDAEQLVGLSKSGVVTKGADAHWTVGGCLIAEIKQRT